MQVVLVNETIGHRDERNFACEAAIVPPVYFECGYVIFVTGVIDGSNQKIGAGLEYRGDLALKGGVTTLMFADLFAIDPKPGAVVCRAHMEEDSGMFPGLVIEVAFIPHWS